jgi:diguanylate cyclase (GGDEF)-like protein
MIAVLSLFPAISLWGAYPRRKWASSASAGGIVVLWLIGFLILGGEHFAMWAAAGACGMISCFYALHVIGRNSEEYEKLESAQAQRKIRNEALAREVGSIKHRIHKVDTEQRETLALYSMIKGLSEALTWDDVRPKLEIAIRQYLGVESFALYVAEQGKMRPIARRRLGSSVGAQWAVLERFLQERKLPLRVPHVIEVPEKAISVPIFEKENLIGYFFVQAPKNADPAALLSKAENFVDEISFAFKRVLLFQEVERHSQTDGLTGLYRRGALDERMREEVVRARTFKTGFCFMLLDIDRFKSLNDKYGHPFGDEVLGRVGRVLRDSFYDTDFVARYGGEEFAVLMPRAQEAGVRRKAEAVRRAVESEVFEMAMQRIRVTISIGIAYFPRDGESAESVLRQADQALYYAKENGRNQAVDISDVRGNS